jgi:hypothetical protein
VRRFLVFAVVIAAAAAFVANASATVLWADEQSMIQFDYLRQTFIFDVGHRSITDEDLTSPTVAAFYETHGFDANFLYWAPIQAIDRPDAFWTSCSDNHGGLCAGANVEPGHQPILDEIGSGQIHVKTWNGAFIGTACGNWNGSAAGPAPTISGVKFDDLNGDGAREAGEPGLAGWTIQLLYNGVTVTSTTTATDGSYSFHLDADSFPIGAGTYSTHEVHQSGWAQSRAPQPISVGYEAANTVFGGNDFGNYKLAAISGGKFEDMNADGSGIGDPGVSGVKIDYAGPSSGSVTTGPDGGFSIGGLAPGVYTVSEELQPGWNESAPASGTYTLTLRSGDSLSGTDFGNWRPATITGRKFDDHGVDGSGVGDPGLAGWTIGLDTGATMQTLIDGSYAFAGLRPGTYTVSEQQQASWRQSAPGTGTSTITVTSGQLLTGADFGNVCLANIAVTAPGGVAMRVEEVNVPGMLANEPALPRFAAGTSTISGLLPGTYRVTLMLPDGVFSTDPDLTAVSGGFAIVKTVTPSECGTTTIAPDFVTSAPGKITGGIRILVPGGFATGGFEFMQRSDGPRGTLEYNDHTTGMQIHTSDITGISVVGTDAYIFGHAVIGGTTYSFRLHLVDAGEPGTSDRFELLVSNGYSAGFSERLDGGNIQMH